MTKLAYQYDFAGLFMGVTEADESPLELGVYHLPAYATFTEPPEEVPDDQWPRWLGSRWGLVNRPSAPEPAADPVEKLRLYLLENPDVAALLEPAA